MALEELKIQNEILKSDKNDIFGEIIDSEFRIKKFGAKPMSVIKQEAKFNAKPSEEVKIEENEKTMTVTIEFDLPAAYYKEEDVDVNIIGTFTQWIPQQMEKSHSVAHRYVYQATMQRGFKHRHQFLVNGNEHIDELK
jgi:hypothetical protein